ncbi:hypothetical protein [Novosphingobium sp. CECT 9465]|uniref:hypothetical protein n=1 Tax=Novosphingobium sp. CECT 9465 TaxID=2829794 RepID=UPI001E431BEE|nr:hypothetical protein [Novosphingobium sp. CECT 9465]
MSNVSPVRFDALRRYVSYIIDFCEEVTADNFEQEIVELYETVCKSIAIMSEIIGVKFNNPMNSPILNEKCPSYYDLIRLVPRNYCIFGSANDYTIIFSPLISTDTAQLYTSRADEFCFALISCFLKHLSRAAFCDEGEDFYGFAHTKIIALK